MDRITERKTSIYGDIHVSSEIFGDYTDKLNDAINKNSVSKNIMKVLKAYEDLVERGHIQVWMPVDIELPKTDDDVWVTAIIADGTLETGRDYYKDGFWHAGFGKVVAWMPMPKPYEGGMNYD